MALSDVVRLSLELSTLEGKRRNGGGLSAEEHERSLELIWALIAATGVPCCTKVEIARPGPVPRGCVRGSDGIVRSAPGVFERRFVAAQQAQRSHLGIRPPVTQRVRGRQTRVTRRIVRGRAQAAHGPPREPSGDDPDPPDVATRRP